MSSYESGHGAVHISDSSCQLWIHTWRFSLMCIQMEVTKHRYQLTALQTNHSPGIILAAVIARISRSSSWSFTTQKKHLFVARLEVDRSSHCWRLRVVAAEERFTEALLSSPASPCSSSSSLLLLYGGRPVYQCLLNASVPLAFIEEPWSCSTLLDST